MTSPDRSSRQHPQAGAPVGTLVIAYYTPPFGGGASVRVHNFIKYLPCHGVLPRVLTVEERFYEELYHDPELLREYPPEVELHRTGVFFGGSLKRAKAQAFAGGAGADAPWPALKRVLKKGIKKLLVPDEQIFWLPLAFLKGWRIGRSGRVKAILATAPPFSCHLLAALLAGACRLPLVLDYRDLWSQNPLMAGSGLALWLNRCLETVTVRRAARIVCTNESAARVMAERFRLPAGKVVVIENGYDGASLAPALSAAPQPAERLRLNYLGSLTTERTPRYLLAALKRLVAARPEVPVEVGFVGFAAEAHRELVREMGLEAWVRFYGALPKAAAQEIMCRDSEVLLVLQRAAEGGATAIPGKIYEYLATGKPVLTMDEGCGATSRFLRELGVDCAVEFDDEEGIFRLLLEVVNDYQAACQRFGAVAARVERYDRRSLAATMAALLRDAAQTTVAKRSEPHD